MREYAILTDSSCDLPAELAKSLEVEALPLTVRVGMRAYRNYLDSREVTPEKFYAGLRAGREARTSAVSPEAFMQALTPILAGGRDALIISFASALSATYQNAREAVAEMAVRQPGGRVICVDSRCASMGQGLLVTLTAQSRQNGASLEEAAALARRLSLKVCHWFTVGDPRFLKRGGRMMASAAQEAGERLHMMPVMRMDEDGRLVGAGRVRGRAAAIRTLRDRVAAEAVELSTQTVFISHGDCPEDAEELKDMVLKLGAARVITGPVGPVIGAHSGPGTLAIFYLGEHR